MGNLRRYVAVIDVYVYAESDEEALELVNNIDDKINIEGFSRFNITELVEQPTGTLGNRLIELKFK